MRPVIGAMSDTVKESKVPCINATIRIGLWIVHVCTFQNPVGLVVVKEVSYGI
jgi:hypothetical protein